MSRKPATPEPPDAVADEPETQTFEIPSDLTTLSDDELGTLIDRTATAVDVFGQNEQPTADDLEALNGLATGLKALKAEEGRRKAEAEELRANFAATLASVRDEPEGDTPADDGGDTPATASDQPVETPAAETSDESGEVEGTTASHRPIVVRMPARASLNPSLEEIGRQRASQGYDVGLNDPRPEVVITAAADVPRLSPGQRIATLDDLVEATIGRAKALGVTNGSPTFVPLATLNREFPSVIDETMNPDAIRKAFEDLVNPHRRNAETMAALVAAGGWCAPSEIRYEFFQISEVAGLWDVPTFGVRRGGLKWPQSLSLADFFALSGAPASGIASATTMPWRWTEADDIATVTGTGTKLCLRPPCPNFDEARLEVFGICVTAGNLTEDAFPELIRHFIAQTVVAHARAMNRRHIALAEAASTATTPVTLADHGASTHILGATELNAIDYREKHGMSDTAVLEVVFPSWLRGLLRSDVAKQNGRELAAMGVQDRMLMDWFDVRNLRTQWVQDWQTRDVSGGIAPAGGAIPTNWPTSAKSLLYAPGTFGRGNGMRLDLGVVRDSVLNAENDHTAAWSEESTLIAKFGHESRVITYGALEATGATGAQISGVHGP